MRRSPRGFASRIQAAPAARVMSAHGVHLRRPGFVFLFTLAVVLAVTAVALALAARVSAQARAVDAGAARTQARAAALGMAQMVAADLTHTWKAGKMPALSQITPGGYPVGECLVFLLDHRTDARGQPTFGLAPANTRLGAASATAAQLAALPGMSSDLAAALKAAKPARAADLRTLDGFTDDLVLGEDANRNGLLDDGEDLNQSGKLDAGLCDWLWFDGAFAAPAKAPDGSAPINAAQLSGKAQTTLVALFGQDRAVAICRAVAPKTSAANIGKSSIATNASSRLQLVSVLGLADDEAAALWPYLAAPSTPTVDPFRSSDEVLSAAVGADLAARLKAARPSTPPASALWAAAVLAKKEMAQYGPLLASGDFTFEADLLAVRADAGGFARVRAVVAFNGGAEAQVVKDDPGGETWPFPAIPLDRLRRQLVGSDAANSPLPTLLPPQALQGPTNP